MVHSLARTFVVGVFVALVAATSAQPTYAFKAKFAEGESQKVKVTMKGNMSGMAIEMIYFSDEKVLKVEPDGTYTEEVKTHGLTLTAAGAPVPLYMDTDKTEVRKHAPTGELLGTDDKEANLAMLRRTGRLGDLPSPAAPVKIGESWTHEYAPVEAVSLPAGKVTYTFVAEEKVGKWDALKVEIAYTEVGVDKPVTAKGFLWLNKENFRGVKGDVTVDNHPAPPGSPVPQLSAQVLFERLD
ncbi:MAG: hypothetical protein KIS66_06640 [Fimbriimonadaceae bacterium]|nr:hypothetical protein [Fimbriimonadaceae bacterium]